MAAFNSEVKIHNNVKKLQCLMAAHSTFSTFGVQKVSAIFFQAYICIKLRNFAQLSVSFVYIVV